MMLEEIAPIADIELPLAEFRQHLRMGTGFGEDTLQDQVLQSFLRAALGAVEGRVSKALIARDFTLSVEDWSRYDCQDFPIAPVPMVLSVDLVDADNNSTTLAATAWRLRQDSTVPQLVTRGARLPSIATGGQAVITFKAGFGSWNDMPADLQQAVLLLAAHYYENRNETHLGAGCMPFGVTALVERYRPMRVSLGSAS